MKWIGQHIWSLISRFRSDVYLEDVSTGTIASGGNLGLDENNKIVKATEASGDITSVTITTDSGGGSAASDTAGSADFSILGATGVGVTNSGTTITAVAVPAEIDHDSLSNFVAAEHYAWASDISGTATIHANNIPTLNQNTTGTAANLTASTSTAVQLGTVELGHANDTTIARSASGTVTIESKVVMTKDKKIHIQQTSFNRDIATDEYFIPFNTTAESANITNVNVPMVMPVAGKLLKIHMRVNQNHNTSSNTCTFKLYDVDDGEIWNSGNSDVLGTKVIDGTGKEDVMVADFTDLTTSGASGTNAFQANDTIGITITNSQDLATTNYVVTFVFELDFNSY
tara:strand:+ start:1001 stop:2029 length:1029 start_codon:yes stop_codon:yes gene_type:complete